MLDDFLIHVFHKGNTLEAYKVFGAHFETTDHKKGVRFTVYAPNARSVQVIGEFNDWDGKNHYMEKYEDVKLVEALDVDNVIPVNND